MDEFYVRRLDELSYRISKLKEKFSNDQERLEVIQISEKMLSNISRLAIPVTMPEESNEYLNSLIYGFLFSIEISIDRVNNELKGIKDE